MFCKFSLTKFPVSGQFFNNALIKGHLFISLFYIKQTDEAMKTTNPLSQRNFNSNFFIYPLALIIISFFISGSTPIQVGDIQKSDSRDKKIILLEKLESGVKVTPEEIRSSFGNHFDYEYGEPDLMSVTWPDLTAEIDIPDVPDLPELADPDNFPVLPEFATDPFYIQPFVFDFNFRCPDSLNCDRQRFMVDEKMLKMDIQELKKQMENIRNSKEFETAKEDFRKSMGEFRKDMEKMKGELRKEFRESGESENWIDSTGVKM
jgi:hypothetical protein